ncbi:hypothetical protein FF19_10415 [Klebsiella michiganensis]|nr:hypothetical protein FF19_10415 [Klebsiella michiganensis]
MINNIFYYYFHIVILSIGIIYFLIVLIGFMYGLFRLSFFSFLSCLLGFFLINMKSKTPSLAIYILIN